MIMIGLRIGVTILIYLSSFTLAVWPSKKKVTPEYYEHLLLQPLPQSALLASFNFRSNETFQAFERQHFRFFPRSLAQVLQHTYTKELHLRFSTGRWDSENWGERPGQGNREGGTGVELWAWIEADTREEANISWLNLMNSLSGLFCASLNFIDSTRTLRPVITFDPEGHHRNASDSNLHLLHGNLPHEVICTENLTPFVKQLPCKGKAGISSLLDGHKLFDSSWQAMAIDVRPQCEGKKKKCVLQIEQNVDMVLNIERSKRKQGSPLPKPVPKDELICDTSKPYHGVDSCFPLNYLTEPSWSLSEVFGQPIKGACPLTTSAGDGAETVCINVPQRREINVKATPPYSLRKSKDGLTRCYKPGKHTDFDLAFPQAPHGQVVQHSQPPLYATRSITGYGQERGGIQTLLRNPSTTSAAELVYFESLPWFMRPYLHTLRATITHTNGTRKPHPIVETYYQTATDRSRSTHLELLLTIPPASTVMLTYSFEKALLRYTEYPPDANRGFDVPSAVIKIRSWEGRNNPTYMRTTNLLLPLPTPDFSMPYNVIILTSTVMALGFGNIFNLLIRRFVGSDEVQQMGLSGLKAKLSALLNGKGERLKDKGEKAQ